MAEYNTCSICLQDVINHPAPTGFIATGSHVSSCGHLFHPACIWKWYSQQTKSSCPICRNTATETENIERPDEDTFDEGECIQISYAFINTILNSWGGYGVTSAVETELVFDQYGETYISRFEFQRILTEQGGPSITDEQWNLLTSMFPMPPPFTLPIGH